MTPKQQKQFNSMLAALKQISLGYYTPTQLRKNADKRFGVEYEEALEMAYENIQLCAKMGCKGIRPIPTDPIKTP